MPLPTWKQLISWIKPEAATADELKWAEAIKTGEYEIYVERLNNICFEGKEVLMRGGVSSMMLAGDNIVGIYTATGDLVDAWCGTYLHAITAQLPIKYIMKYYKDDPTVGINEGDIFYVNDAYYGGIHNGDQIAIIPVFYNGELISWTTSCCHEGETGGCDAGSMPPSAKHKYDEGMRLAPVKIGTNYQIHADMLEVIGNFLDRARRMAITDLRARVAGADRVRVRLEQLAQEKGKEFVLGLFRKMIIDAEQGARKKIRSWNDGIYRATLFTDVAGMEPRLLRICITAVKEEDHVTFDFTGTSPENNTFSHSTLAAVAAHAATHIFAYPFYDLPVSSGTFAPLDWFAPEGTIFNPAPNASCCNSVGLDASIMMGLPLVLARMMFDSQDRPQIAASGGASCDFPTIIGINQWGVPMAELHTFACNSMGHSARYDQDGVLVYGFQTCHTGRTPDAEETENDWPILHLFQRVRQDSCGPGKYRGGASGEFAYASYGVPYCLFGCFSGGGLRVSGGQGIFGGYPGRNAGPITEVLQSNLFEAMAKGEKEIPKSLYELVIQRKLRGNYQTRSAMINAYVALPGTVFSAQSGGGSGYGDLLERDPEAVIQDLKQQVISDWAVTNVYHVVYNPENLKVDYERTKEMRQKVREQRLKQGKRYEEFEKEWLQKKPPEEALALYGSWPDAKPLRPVTRV